MRRKTLLPLALYFLSCRSFLQLVFTDTKIHEDKTFFAGFVLYVAGINCDVIITSDTVTCQCLKLKNKEKSYRETSPRRVKRCRGQNPTPVVNPSIKKRKKTLLLFYCLRLPDSILLSTDLHLFSPCISIKKQANRL